MLVAIISDTHAGCRQSSDVFIEHQRKFYEDCFFPYLEEHNIKKILHLGDYYESRTSINFKALHANRKMFLEPLRERKIHMDIIPGNHDTYFKNTNDLNALKELLGHYMNEVRIIEDPTVVEYGSLKIGLIPWINPENESKIRTFVDNCSCDFIGGHFEFNGFEMHAGISAPEGMDHRLFSRFELVMSGHYHTKSRQDNVVYFGSQMEFTWSDCDDPKYFHVLDTETREITAVRNPFNIFEKVYYDDEAKNPALMDVRHLNGKFVKLVVVNKTDIKKFDGLVDRINSAGPHALNIIENFSEYKGTSVQDEDVSLESPESLLYSYIDATSTTLDKGKIKSFMHELMVEAQTLEVE